MTYSSDQYSLEQYKKVNIFIRYGMATILWGDAWAAHVEASDDNGEACYRLSGKDIIKVMPKIPKIAWQLAYKLGKKYKQQNSEVSIVELFAKAHRVNYNYSSECSDDVILDDLSDHHNSDPDSPFRFGQCLAYMSLGHGVSWFDDHEEFTICIPLIENYPLQDWARDTCRKCNEN